MLTREISPELVDEVVAATGRRELRRRLLPAATVVYFVLALSLFSGADSMVPPGYRSVMRWLSNGLRQVRGPLLASSSALVKGRQRLGVEPLQVLFARQRRPLGGPGTPGVFAFGRRLVAWDGTGLDLADTPQNEEAFGRLCGGCAQVRLLTLTECGTHARRCHLLTAGDEPGCSDVGSRLPVLAGDQDESGDRGCGLTVKLRQHALCLGSRVWLEPAGNSRRELVGGVAGAAFPTD